MSVQPPHQPQTSNAMSSGFRGTIGVILALFTVFFILPCGACVACNGGVAAIGAFGSTVQDDFTPSTEEIVPPTNDPETVPVVPEEAPTP